MLRVPEDLVPASSGNDLKRFVAYWIEKAAGRPFPSFADIDPIEIAWALPRLYLVRVIDGGADFVYRLAGEEVNRRYGGSIAGKRIEELLAKDAAREIKECWRRMIAGPEAYYSEVRHLTNRGVAVRGRRVTLPLGPDGGPDGGPVDHIVGLTVFETAGEGEASLIADRSVLDMRWVALATAA